MVAKNATETFRAASIRKDLQSIHGRGYDTDTIPGGAEQRPPTKVRTGTIRDAQALKWGLEFRRKIQEAPNIGARTRNDLRAKLQETDQLLDLAYRCTVLPKPGCQKLAEMS